MGNKVVKTSESRLQTEPKDKKKEEKLTTKEKDKNKQNKLSTKRKDKKKEKKISTKPKSKWWQRDSSHVSSLPCIHYLNGVFPPAFILPKVSNGECQIKTHFGVPLIVCNGIRGVIIMSVVPLGT
jgi:hypothetical protein